MSRRSEVASSYEKPAEMYLEWKSDEQSFSYYDKSQGKNIAFNPGKFLFLMIDQQSKDGPNLINRVFIRMKSRIYQQMI